MLTESNLDYASNTWSQTAQEFARYLSCGNYELQILIVSVRRSSDRRTRTRMVTVTVLSPFNLKRSNIRVQAFIQRFNSDPLVPCRKLESCSKIRLTSVPHPSNVPKREAQPKINTMSTEDSEDVDSVFLLRTWLWDSSNPTIFNRTHQSSYCGFPRQRSSFQRNGQDIHCRCRGREISFGLKIESWYINPSYRIGGKTKDRYYESPGGINVGLKLQWHLCTMWRSLVLHLIWDSLPLLSILTLSRLTERMRLITSVRFSVPAISNCD